MKSINNTCVIIQARVSSERCPKKMVRPFAGTTLTDIALKKLLKSKVIPKKNIFLSAYDEELKQIAIKNDINVFNRSEKSATWDGGPGSHIKEIFEWWNQLPFEHVVMINACVPLLKIKTIDEFILDFINSEEDGAFGVIAKKNYFWDENFNFLTPLNDTGLNTKKIGITYEAAHCLYGSKMKSIGGGVWMGDFSTPGGIKLLAIDEEECYDIDYEWQFKACEALYKEMVINGD